VCEKLNIFQWLQKKQFLRLDKQRCSELKYICVFNARNLAINPTTVSAHCPPPTTQHVWWLLDLSAAWVCLAVWTFRPWCLNIPYWEPFRPPFSCGRPSGTSALPSVRAVGTTEWCRPSRDTSATAGGGIVSAPSVLWSPRDSGSWPHRYGRHLLKLLTIRVSLTFQSLLVTWCTNSLTFNNCTLCPHCIYVFCIYLRTNSDLCHLQHKLIGFYNRDEKCLQRGTDWSFK